MKINCVVCGKETLAINKNKKTCSSTCRGKLRDPKKVKDWHLKQRSGELLEVTKFRDRIKYFEMKENDPEAIKSKNRRKYLKGQERYKKYALDYQEKNKEKIEIVKKLYRVSDHGKLKSQKDCRNRRARLNDVKHDFSEEEWKMKIESTKGYCPTCNEFVGVLKLSLDHTPPLSKAPFGFVYTIKEVSPLCKSCNSKKYNKI